MSKIKLIKNNSTQTCVDLQKVLDQCPNFDCLNHPGEHLNLSQLYQITADCFSNLNRKITQASIQTGGGCDPSTFNDEIKVDANQLKRNLHQYLILHKINQLTPQTLLPFGIIISTLNLPNEFEILSTLCPDLKDYLQTAYKGHIPLNNNQIDKGALIPIGIFLNQEDITDINKLF